ncbi:MAG: thioredoxin domain-containing protein, partial [Thermomicrobiaceae bacterium]|nr:thioredoxin domain-containing protein [Thermomicrobiaceae bacterium]
AALPPREAEIAKRYFGVTEAGNFEGKTVLSVPEPLERIAADLAMSPDALEAAVREIRDRLYAARAGRVWPGRDEKVLAAWNGLMLRALAEVGAALDRPDYVHAATRCARFLRDHLDRGGTLSRVFKDGRAHVDGYLEDYAALADGLVSLYEATFEPAWLDWARDLLARAVDRFADPQGGGFFDTPATAGDLITRPKDVFDSATPSGNALAAEALLRVAALTGEAADRQRALDLIERWAGFAAEHPTGFGQLLCDADLALAPIDEVALVGDPADPGTRALLAVVRRPYLPHKVVALARPGGDEASRVPLLAGREAQEGRPTAYVCRGFACLQPVTDPAALAAQLGLEA